jgi:hypothetical protein
MMLSKVGFFEVRGKRQSATVNDTKTRAGFGLQNHQVHCSKTQLGDHPGWAGRNVFDDRRKRRRRPRCGTRAGSLAFFRSGRAASDQAHEEKPCFRPDPHDSGSQLYHHFVSDFRVRFRQDEPVTHRTGPRLSAHLVVPILLVSVGLMVWAIWSLFRRG